MIAKINSENESRFHFILNFVNKIKAASKRPDNQIDRPDSWNSN